MEMTKVRRRATTVMRKATTVRRKATTVRRKRAVIQALKIYTITSLPNTPGNLQMLSTKVCSMKMTKVMKTR